eukprot:gene29461-38559_t
MISPYNLPSSPSQRKLPSPEEGLRLLSLELPTLTSGPGVLAQLESPTGSYFQSDSNDLYAYDSVDNNGFTTNGNHYKLADWYSFLFQQLIPSVFAVFINLLDACTFGTVFLPDFVGNTAGLIVKLFIISTVVAQLLITAYSSFNSGLGTSMAENIPFIHTMAKDIHNLLIEDPLIHSKLLPTILVTVALSTIFNGIVICSYVIMGMISGFGVFLIATAFEISTGQSPSIQSVTHLSSERVLQLLCVLAVEALLRVISVAVRDSEMVISMVMLAVDCYAVFSQLPTMASLAIFTVILVPLRGAGKVSRYLITFLTFGLFFFGAEILNLTPKLIAGVIMVHLGIDLLIGTLLNQKLDLAIAEGRLKIVIVALQGHLFFGNIQTVVEKIQGYLPSGTTPMSSSRKNSYEECCVVYAGLTELLQRTFELEALRE